MVKKKLIESIKSQRLFSKMDKLLLAVSGGADSMAMLHLLVDEGYTCEVAHVNFQLRGEESDGDALLVERVASDLGLEFHLLSVDTLAYASEHKLSMEMAARTIRYDFFDDLLHHRSLDYVVVAHHKNDVVETFFINLMRGTGLRGLAGIEAKKGRVVRPLLYSSHQELLDYLVANNFEYRTDASNFDTTIKRNKLRQDLIPKFEVEKPGFNDIMLRTIGRLCESERIVNAFVKDWKSKHLEMKEDVTEIPKQALYDSVSPSAILFDVLQPLGFSNAVIDDLAAQPDKRVGAIFESGLFRLTVDRDNLIIDEYQHFEDSFMIAFDTTKIQVPLAMHFSILTNETAFERTSLIANLDFDLLQFPMTLRKWQEGDVFSPIGMKGRKKKVSDFFIDNKFSIPEKERTWLLCSGDNIVWVVGHRLDDRYKVNAETKRIYRIKLEE